MASPISAIRYECEVLETDIPYTHKDKNIHISKVMNLKLLNIFPKDAFDLQTLKTYGVTTVRGPRSVPSALLHELRRF